MYAEADQINAIIEAAQSVLVIQADNPDADSLGSALALEQILGERGKSVNLYCAVDMPSYLHYMSGWDRVSSDLPRQFDSTIIVDASTMTLLEKMVRSGQHSQLSSKPCIVLDHHQVVDNLVPFATVMLNDYHRSSCGELIYALAKQLEWPIDLTAMKFILNSILGDTQGLTNSLASAETYRIIAEFLDAGLDRAVLEEERRAYSKMPASIYAYKAELISRTAFYDDGRIAYIIIPQSEINQFSPLYNPAPLIQGDMLQVIDVEVAIVFKQYDDGRVTAAVRCNSTAPIAAELAGHFGGGGHAFAGGFKVTGREIDVVRQDCLTEASQLLNKLRA